MTEEKGLTETRPEMLLHGFFQALDERRYHDQVAMIAESGTWLRQGKLLTGPGEILRALAERPADFHTAHLITNMTVHEAGGEAHATFLSLVFAHRGPRQEGAALPLTPAQVARYEAVLADVGAGWQIRSLQSAVLFKS